MTAPTSGDTPVTAPTPHRERTTSIPGLVVKIVFLCLVVGAVVYAAPLMIQYQLWMWLGVLIAITVGILLLYSTKRFIPGKYLFPGTVLLSVLLIIPIILTIGYSFTNFGDGSRGTKQQTIDSVVASSVMPTPDSPWYAVSIAVEAGSDPTAGPFALFLVKDGDDSGTVYTGVDGGELEQWTGESPTVTGGKVTAVPGFDILNLKQANAVSTQLAAITIRVPGDATAGIKMQGLRAYQGKATITYDAVQDALVTADGKTFPNQMIGVAYCFADPSFANGCFQGRSWLQNVGWHNYARLLGNADIRDQFLAAFGWNLIFAAASVVITFVLGFALALSLNDKRLKGRKLWRSFLLLPYAVPGMISLLLWSNFFNKDFGLINQIFHINLNWFGDPTLAKIAVLIVQLWMGFPYWFIVCTGALQSVSGDLKEAAQIDGASGLQTTTRIVFPLLLISVTPLVVASFAFNFNNFNAIRLLTEGAPALSGQFTRGGTDILISMIYKQAFGGSGTNYGFASAMAVMLFILTGIIAAVQFRVTKKVEDMA